MATDLKHVPAPSNSPPESARKKTLEILQGLQALATIGAILAGAVWFAEQRQTYAHMKLEHKVTHLSLPGHRILLILDVTHSNVGLIKVALRSADIRVYGLAGPELTGDLIGKINNGSTADQIEPQPPWTLLASQSQKWDSDQLFIEPGESNHLHYEFVLSDDEGPLVIYTFYGNPTIKRSDVGWSMRSVYDPHAAQSR